MNKVSVALINMDNMQIRIVRNFNKSVGVNGSYITETSVKERFQTIEHEYDNLSDAWAYVTSKVMLADGG